MPRKSFETWYAEVDAAIADAVGIGASDFADQPYFDWYEGGATPAAAARRAIKNALADV